MSLRFAEPSGTDGGSTEDICYARFMGRIEAVEKLKPFEARLRALGATSLYLFGSTAKGTAGVTSDLDLFVEYDATSRFNLLDLVTAKFMVEDELGMSADLATRDGLHPRYKDEIERDAIRIF